MNSYSISIYSPQKASSSLPFYLSLNSDTVNHQQDVLESKRPKTFNVETASDYMNKNIFVNDIYVKEYTMNMYLDKSRPMESSIGFAKGIFINTRLMDRDGLTVYDIYSDGDEENHQADDPFIMKLLLSISDEEGYATLHGKGNIFYISQIYVKKKQRGKGFGRYLIQNFPEYLERFYGLSFKMIACPLLVFESNEDADFLNSEEASKKFQSSVLSAMYSIFDKENYSKLYDDAYNTGSEDVTLFVKMLDLETDIRESN